MAIDFIIIERLYLVVLKFLAEKVIAHSFTATATEPMEDGGRRLSWFDHWLHVYQAADLCLIFVDRFRRFNAATWCLTPGGATTAWLVIIEGKVRHCFAFKVAVVAGRLISARIR